MARLVINHTSVSQSSVHEDLEADLNSAHLLHQHFLAMNARCSQSVTQYVLTSALSGQQLLQIVPVVIDNRHHPNQITPLINMGQLSCLLLDSGHTSLLCTNQHSTIGGT